jgi:hypothetical protein
MRARPIAAAALVTLALGALGCGAAYKLPNEVSTGRPIPSDQSYQMIATWSGMTGISDILLVSQGTGAQLFLLFNRGGTTTAPRGEVKLYPLTRPEPINDIVFPTVFNPVAMASGANNLFVLDRGDTSLARDPANSEIRDLFSYRRVRQYGPSAATLSTFTDTTMAFVRGVAADAQGRVYVSGIAIVLISDQTNPSIRTRTFHRASIATFAAHDIRVIPPDYNMPGADWHRDTTWVVEEGSGIGTC